MKALRVVSEVRVGKRVKSEDCDQYRGIVLYLKVIKGNFGKGNSC